MTPADIEAILTEAFSQCTLEGEPLSHRQQQILLSLVGSDVMAAFNRAIAHDEAHASVQNPLDDLTPEQRRAFMAYVQVQGASNMGWKVQLLNDWVEGRDSGSVQFIREEYGLSWLEQIQPTHIYQYLETESLRLHVGDRIEVSNALWEWVQKGAQEWFSCLVIALDEESSPMGRAHTRCTVRFDNGMEAEIQGIYDWNRYNWRLPQD